MPKLIMTYGLPASGKSTWTKEYQKNNPNTKRVNKDELRAMLDDGVWNGDNEKFLLNVRNFVISQALSKGLDMICDDTNLDPKHEKTLRDLAENHKAEFQIKDFSHITLAECLKRDQQRQNWVGEKVIRTMYLKYLATKVEPTESPKYDPNLPDCYIFDLDGTLAKMNGRSPFDWDKVDMDVPNMAVCLIYSKLRLACNQTKFFILSGRDEICEKKTRDWLTYQFGMAFSDGLFMRSNGDMRDDRIIKQEIYEREIKGKFNVLGVFDDRNKVVEFWRSIGLTCFQVADGDF